MADRFANSIIGFLTHTTVVHGVAQEVRTQVTGAVEYAMRNQTLLAVLRGRQEISESGRVFCR